MDSEQYYAEQFQRMLRGVEGSTHVQHVAIEQQQYKKTTKTSKPAKIATINLEEYVRVFNNLTDGKGNVVLPNRDKRLFTAKELRSVIQLHALRTHGEHSLNNKDGMLQRLLGVELWNPHTLPPGPYVPVTISNEEMEEDLRVLQW